MHERMTEADRKAWLENIRREAVYGDSKPWRPHVVPALLAEVERLERTRDAALDRILELEGALLTIEGLVCEAPHLSDDTADEIRAVVADAIHGDVPLDVTPTHLGEG